MTIVFSIINYLDLNGMELEIERQSYIQRIPILRMGKSEGVVRVGG
jgi:hypothetical protein